MTHKGRKGHGVLNFTLDTAIGQNLAFRSPFHLTPSANLEGRCLQCLVSRKRLLSKDKQSGTLRLHPSVKSGSDGARPDPETVGAMQHASANLTVNPPSRPTIPNDIASA